MSYLDGVRLRVVVSARILSPSLPSQIGFLVRVGSGGRGLQLSGCEGSVKCRAENEEARRRREK